MSEVIKLSKSVVKAISKDNVFAQKMLGGGYHIDANYEVPRGENDSKNSPQRYLFTSAWLIFDGELNFEDFSNDPQWFGVDYTTKYYTSIDISKVFMYDVSVIEPYVYIDEDSKGKWDTSYSAYSDFDSCTAFLDKFCPCLYPGRNVWSKPKKNDKLYYHASTLYKRFSDAKLVCIADDGGTPLMSVFSDFSSNGCNPCFEVHYDENVVSDNLIANIVSTVEKMKQPVKEVYFVLSDSIKGNVIARKNSDGELTLTVY